MLQSVSISQRGDFICIWYLVLVTDAHGIPFGTSLGFGGLGACIPRSQRAITVRQLLSSKGIAKAVNLNIFMVFLKRGPICSCRSSGLSRRLLVWYTSRTYSWGRELVGTVLCLPLPHSSLLIIFQKAAYILVWCPNFFSCHQGTPLHCPAQAAMVAYTHGSYRTTTRRKTAMLRAQQEVTDPGAQSFCERGLKAYYDWQQALGESRGGGRVVAKASH